MKISSLQELPTLLPKSKKYNSSKLMKSKGHLQGTRRTKSNGMAHRVIAALLLDLFGVDEKIIFSISVMDT